VDAITFKTSQGVEHERYKFNQTILKISRISLSLSNPHIKRTHDQIYGFSCLTRPPRKVKVVARDVSRLGLHLNLSTFISL